MMGGVKPEDVAIKLIDDEVDSEDKDEIEKQRKRNQREPENMVDHPNIVRSLAPSGTFEYGGADYIYTVMEKCEEHTLYEIAEKSFKEIGFKFRKVAMLQVFHALSHIHRKHVLHRDLKPQNVLKLDKNMKIADFRHSKKKRPDKTRASKSTKEIGTEGWGSPESYEGGESMSIHSDMYSSGLVLFFVLTKGQHPFGPTASYWRTNIMRNEGMDVSPLKCLDSPDKEISLDLISKLLQSEPKQRPVSEEVLKHPFFWDDDKKLEFLCDVSDSRETLPLPNILAEEISQEKNWLDVLKMEGEDGPYYDNAKKPEYNHNKVLDLLRFIRDTRHRYTTWPGMAHIASSRADLWKFYSVREFIGNLFCKLYNGIKEMIEDPTKTEEVPGDIKKYYEDMAKNVGLPEI